jgi:hypothetical protein
MIFAKDEVLGGSIHLTMFYQLVRDREIKGKLVHAIAIIHRTCAARGTAHVLWPVTILCHTHARTPSVYVTIGSPLHVKKCISLARGYAFPANMQATIHSKVHQLWKNAESTGVRIMRSVHYHRQKFIPEGINSIAENACQHSQEYALSAIIPAAIHSKMHYP